MPTQVSSRPLCAVQQPPVGDDACTDAGAHMDIHQVVDVGPGCGPLPQREHIGIVGGEGWQA